MSRRPGDPTGRPMPTDDAESERRRFAATVTRLRSEVEHLRRAFRHRAVIEQAKGMLAERSGGTPDEAFTTLTALSQTYNVKLVQLAATVVGAAVPPPPAPEEAEVTPALGPAAAAEVLAELSPRPGPAAPPIPRDRPAPADTAEDRARFQLLSARLLSARSPAEVLTAVMAESAWPSPPRAGYLFALEADGALRMLAGAGVGVRCMSEWRRVPPGLDLPFTVSSRFGVPLWVENEEEGLRRFPQLASLPGAAAPAFCTLPLSADGLGVGVLGLTWAGPQAVGDSDRGFLLGVAERVSARLAELSAGDPTLSTSAPRGPVDGVGPTGSDLASPLLIQLETMFDPAALLTPIRVDGEVVDFRFDYCNAATVDLGGRPGTDLVGRTLLELYPGWSSSGWFDAYVQTLVGGTTTQFDRVHIPAGTDGATAHLLIDLRVARLWDGLLLTWRQTPEPDGALLDLLVRAEDATGSGAFSYDCRTGRLTCSPGAYRLAGWDTARGALGPEDLAVLLAPADRDAARDAAALAAGGQPVTVGLGLADGRYVTVTGRPVRDATGHLLRIDGKIRAAADRGTRRSPAGWTARPAPPRQG
jgi:PAS domain-containing protein